MLNSGHLTNLGQKAPLYGQASSSHVPEQQPTGHAAPEGVAAGEKALQTLVAALQSDPALCRRLAAAVDAPTAEAWARARAGGAAAAEEAGGMVAMPGGWQLWKLHVRSAVPFVGFGFFDNMIMLTVGGAIEATIGVAFGISTLAAAGMGQMVSDASGITLQGLIERFADRLGLPCPGLTPQQAQLAFVKSFVLCSRILGIVFGCCLGMFPLVLMPEKKLCLVDQIAQALPPQRRCEFVSLVTAREFQEGEKILSYGDMSDFVFLVERGQVECVGRDAAGLPFHVCTMGPGHSFGRPQLHCPSHMDLVAKGGSVLVQSIEKDDFLRVTGQEGVEALESAQQMERKVYMAAQGQRIVDAVPPPRKGTGKTRMFAALSEAEKCEVLALTGNEAARGFAGVPNEGKVRFFAGLSEDEKHDALAKWHAQKFQKGPRVRQQALQ